MPELLIELKEVAPHEIVLRVLKAFCDLGVADIRDLHDESEAALEALPVLSGSSNGKQK